MPQRPSVQKQKDILNGMGSFSAHSAKIAALMLTVLHAKNVLPAIHGDAQNHISCLGHTLVIFLDLTGWISSMKMKG